MQLTATSPIRIKPVRFSNLKTGAVSSWQWVWARRIVFLALVAGALCILALYVATRDKILIGPFSVPREYEERGYTSEAMSSAVVQFIHGNESTVSLTQPRHLLQVGETVSEDSDDNADDLEEISASIDGKHVVSSFNPSNIPDVKIPLTSFSLETLIELLRTTIGRQPTRIAGQIVMLDEADSSAAADPQHARVLIRYRVEYPEPSYFLGYHWWSRRTTTVDGSLTANGAEEVVRKLALITADGLGRRTLVNEDEKSRAERLMARGNSYFGLNIPGKAERMYALANSLAKSGHAYLCLGVIEEQLGNYPKAQKYYEDATLVPSDDSDNDAAWAKLYLGNMLLKRHELNPAIKIYRSITESKPNTYPHLVRAAAQNNLAFVYLNKNWSDAKGLFESAQDIAQKLYEAAETCAYSDGKISRCEDAQSEAERAKSKTEAFVSIDLANQLRALTHYGLGQISLKSGEKGRTSAENHFREAVQYNVSFAPAHYQLARLYIEEKGYKNAIDELQKTIQFDPGFEKAYGTWKSLIDNWKDLPGR